MKKTISLVIAMVMAMSFLAADAASTAQGLESLVQNHETTISYETGVIAPDGIVADNSAAYGVEVKNKEFSLKVRKIENQDKLNVQLGIQTSSTSTGSTGIQAGIDQGGEYVGASRNINVLDIASVDAVGKLYLNGDYKVGVRKDITAAVKEYTQNEYVSVDRVGLGVYYNDFQSQTISTELGVQASPKAKDFKKLKFGFYAAEHFADSKGEDKTSVQGKISYTFGANEEKTAPVNEYDIKGNSGGMTNQRYYPQSSYYYYGK